MTRGRPGDAQRFRELPSPNSILFRAPKWSPITDGDTEAQRCAVTCGDVLWVMGAGGWGLGSVVRLRVGVGQMPCACRPCVS